MKEFAFSPASGDLAPSSAHLDRLLSRRETMPIGMSAPCLSDREESGSRGVPGEGAAPAFAIVAESTGDVFAREALLDRAMGIGRKRKSSEKLRRGRKPSEGLAFVARDAAGRVVGTVRLWDVAIGHDGRTVLLLGPLAVDPAMKSVGIGSKLTNHAIAEATRLGHRAILLVGDAPYYARFGFTAEKTGALAMPGPYERHRFLALELEAGALDGAHGVLKAVGRASSPAAIRGVEHLPVDRAVRLG
jgi:predicted N-acetyltransferase YhbS